MSKPHYPQSPAYEAQEPTQVKLLDENATPNALPLISPNTGISDEHTDTREDADLPRCHRCEKRARHVSKNAPICAECYGTLQAQATEQQERDYLRRWLHSRVDEIGEPLWGHTTTEQATIRRLCAKARRLQLDWKVIPLPTTYAARMRALLAPFGNDHDGSDGPDGGEAA